MSKARNKKTEAVRLSLPVVDLINYLAKENGLSFKEMESRIVREWAESKGMIR
jgi:predicted DNA-binding protein